ncbi:MAG: N-(5'-phosphoribosyl)anthranilate isomerase [Rhizobiaceae bacterium MnEN-MB40S]|nr:MAG: N-(5'-phosphoribosyl)anthranilate isomerase [Rhizobiaceae bacterium MnEN-MB40S]
MTTTVKICGMKTEETIEAALASGASLIGFIFFEKSPRNVTPEEAGRLRRGIGDRASVVAVTVNADDAVLDRIVDEVNPDYLQLHGGETPDRVRQVRARYGLPVIKVFSIRDAADIEAIRAWRGVADRFLLDAKAPAGSELPGGNGVSFDWSLLRALDGDVDYMLSGGLNAGNVSAALEITGAMAIDVSSGVESAPGVKDSALISRFFEKVAAVSQPVA